MMSHKRLLIAATIIALVIIAGFMLSVPHTRDLPLPPEIETEGLRVPEVMLRDTYRKGVHTISGTTSVPDVCTSVSASASLVGGDSSIEVAVTTTEDDGICLERKTDARFSTTITAPAGMPVTVSVNGVPATTIAL